MRTMRDIFVIIIATVVAAIVIHAAFAFFTKENFWQINWETVIMPIVLFGGLILFQAYKRSKK